MTKGRLEAFSDGVIAIIITIMVLELKVPHSGNFAALKPIIPYLFSYMLSFIYVGIYWNNHHHLLHAAMKTNGKILWANLHLLFWLSLIPFVTGWAGENYFAPATMVAYGFILLMSAIAYNILQRCIVAFHGKDSVLSKAIGKDIKGKTSIILYTVAMSLSFVHEWFSASIYFLVAVMWFVPDKRIEKMLEDKF